MSFTLPGHSLADGDRDGDRGMRCLTFRRSHNLHPVSATLFRWRDMADYTDIAVKGSVDNVRNLVTQVFAANGFQVSWAAATKGKAEKGSKGKIGRASCRERV